MREAIVLGCGYTGARVATRLVTRGLRVLAVSLPPSPPAPAGGEGRGEGASFLAADLSEPRGLDALAAAAARLGAGCGIVCLLPPVVRADGSEATAEILAACGRPARVVHVSSTSVYGDVADVDVTTPVPPHADPPSIPWVRGGRGERGCLVAERAVASGPWSWIVLRAAAIYGPGRGLHASGGAAPHRPGDPDRVVSRIHVEDLAALCDAALASRATGTFPVADRAPASPREVMSFCAALGLPVPTLPAPVPGAGRGRRVDGRAAFDALGVALAFPSYREGIPASLDPAKLAFGRGMG